MPFLQRGRLWALRQNFDLVNVQFSLASQSDWILPRQVVVAFPLGLGIYIDVRIFPRWPAYCFARNNKNTRQMNWEEAIQEYYQMKQKQQQERADNLTLPDSLPPRCISCRRPVGTLWSRLIIEGQTHLYAICGDSSNPCSLLLDIALPIVADLNKVMHQVQSEIAEIKTEIILIKNNLLFGYLTDKEALAQLEETSQNLITKTKLYEYYYQTYFLKIESLADTGQDAVLLGKLVQEIQTLVTEFRQSNLLDKIRNANDLLLHEILPLAEKIQQHRFAVRNVLQDPPLWILYNQEYSNEQMEIILKDGQVVHWNLSISRAPIQTRKRRAQPGTAKTRKRAIGA